MIFFVRMLPVIVGLLCIVIAFLPGRRSRISHPVCTSGTVVAHRRQRTQQHRSEVDCCAPVVRYETPSGEITATARQFLPEWQYRLHIGDPVQLCYDRDQPDVFELRQMPGLRRTIALTIGIGTLLAYGMLWLQYR